MIFQQHLLPLEKLELESMASGELSLRLTTAVSWVLFGLHARGILWVLGGRIVFRADSPFERVWEVLVDVRGFTPVMKCDRSAYSLAENDARAERESPSRVLSAGA